MIRHGWVWEVRRKGRRTTYTTHGFVQHQTDSLDWDIPLLSLVVYFTESSKDSSGDETSSSNSDE